MPRTEAILDFWLKEVGPKGWYAGGAELDAKVSRQFRADWDTVLDDGPEQWQGGPRQVLAYIILTDQFPRNMFRDDPRAYSTDELARKAGQRAIQLGWDERIEPPERQFFYLPLMHSEAIADQDRCVRLFLTRMEGAADSLLHARAHRAVIRRFGRFPHRNAALGRMSTPDEQDYIANGGYAAIVESLRS
jgi:uncharacterized protein (DUF924 family)